MGATETAPQAETAKDVYGIITAKIIAQLEMGTIPWHKPWTESGLPKNIITGNYYRGINMMLLTMMGYEQNHYISFKQLQAIGAKVKKGEKAHMIVFWREAEREVRQPEAVEGEKPSKKKFILRYHYVFNVSQCENVPVKYLSLPRETKEIPTCESIVTDMPHCPPIRHKEQKAYYNFKDDFVNMPKKKSFKSDESYYSTLFHELVHSTGHESRLRRQTIAEMSEFGGETYSLEELIAEIGTCYLQSHAGITSEFQQSAAYIHGWLGKLKNDKRFIFTASKASQKAVDYILNVQSVFDAAPDKEDE